MVPLGILLLLLMGIGTIIPWRRTTMAAFKRQFIIPIIATAGASPVILGAYWYGRGAALGVTPTPTEASYAIITVVCCIFAVTTMIADVGRAMNARMRKHEESAFEALSRLFIKQRRRYGGYVVHLGIVCAFVAFAGNALKIEQDISLDPGDTYQIGDYTLTYEGLTLENEPDKDIIIGKMRAERNGKHVHDLRPGKAVFHSAPNMPTSEIDIKTSPIEDLYVALVNHDPRTQAAAFKIFVAPFTWWFWLGGTILLLGTLICMWPTRDSLETLRPSPGVFVRATAFGALAILCVTPLAVLTYESHTSWGSAARFERMIGQEEIEGTNEPLQGKERAPGKTEQNASGANAEAS
jgi:cytochrome c-type biogenesis protein CcmF